MAIEDLGLTYVIDSGAVAITRQIGCGITVTRLYDVREICPDQFAAGSLENVIKRQSSGLWLDIDHEGGSVSHLKPGIMVIRQSPEVQDEIAEMLMRIREMKATNSNLPKFEDHLLTRYYRVDAKLAESLRKSLWKLVEVGQEDDPELKEIVVVASGDSEPPQATMVITHRRSVHRQIDKVIERLQSGDSPLGETENIGTEVFRQPHGENDPNMGFGGGFF